MPQREAKVWCKALGKRVRVVLTKIRLESPGEEAVPAGWGVRKCLDQGLQCAGKECPFRMVCGADEEN